MNNKILLEKLKAIQKKINDNSIEAWNDKLDETHCVVIQEDFKKGVENKYNGWGQDLASFIQELEDIQNEIEK